MKKNEEVFSAVKADYQITSNINNIDIARIIIENKHEAKCIFIASRDNFIVLVKKKFANIIEKNIISDIIDPVHYNVCYGFKDAKKGAYGHFIISNGFTHFAIYPIAEYNNIFSTLKDVDSAEAKRVERLVNVETIKVATI